MNILDRFKASAGRSETEKAFVVWLSKYAALFVVFLVVFLPVQRQLANYQSTQKQLKNQIAGLKQMSEGFLNKAEIEDIQHRQELFVAMLADPTKAAALIDQISDEAEKHHLKLIQIYSDSPISIKNAEGREMELEGKRLSYLPINFRTETDYKNLANFLYSLRENTIALHVVEALHIQKVSDEAATLQCDITLSYISK